MKKIFEIIANTAMSQTEKIIAIVCEIGTLYAEKGKQYATHICEMVINSPQVALTEQENTIIVLCVKDLFARGNLSFVKAMFAEEDILKLYDYEYRQQFLPENRYDFQDRTFKKWHKIETLEVQLAGLWVYYKLPFLKELLEAVIKDMQETRDYMEEADTTKENYLYLVAQNIDWSNTPKFIDSVVDTLCDIFMNISLDDFGVDKEGFEAVAWHAFCQEPYGLIHFLNDDYDDFTIEVGRNMLHEYV